MQPVLRLCEDVLSDGAAVSLPALPRMAFVVHGAIAAPDGVLRDGEAWSGEDEATFKAGPEGATVWRWELMAAEAAVVLSSTGIVSREKLAAHLDTLPAGPLLLRGDSVAFPPGGCAYRERAGTGVRPGGHRPANPLHPRHDPAGSLSRQKLARISQRRRQVQAEEPAVQDLYRYAD